jgi:hypothetical protein
LLLARKDRTSGALTLTEEEAVRQAVLVTVAPLLAVNGAGAPATGRLNIVGIPAQDECEEVPLHLLAGVIEKTGGRAAVLTTRLLPSELVRQTGAAGATAVVISNMAPGGLPQTDYLCRQLRKQYPALLIIVARWGSVRRYDELLVRLRKAGASYLTTSLAQTITQLNAAADGSFEKASSQAAASGLTRRSANVL